MARLWHVNGATHANHHPEIRTYENHVVEMIHWTSSESAADNFKFFASSRAADRVFYLVLTCLAAASTPPQANDLRVGSAALQK